MAIDLNKLEGKILKTVNIKNSYYRDIPNLIESDFKCSHEILYFNENILN